MAIRSPVRTAKSDNGADWQHGASKQEMLASSHSLSPLAIGSSVIVEIHVLRDAWWERVNLG